MHSIHIYIYIYKLISILKSINVALSVSFAILEEKKFYGGKIYFDSCFENITHLGGNSIVETL